MKFKIAVLLILVISFNLRGERNHLLPLFSSLVFPGGGQFYNGKIVKGAVYASIEGGLLYGAIVQNSRYEDAKEQMDSFSGDKTDFAYRKLEHEVSYYRKEKNTFIWLTAAALLLSAGDAFVDSHFKEFKREELAGWEFIPSHQGITVVYNF